MNKHVLHAVDRYGQLISDNFYIHPIHELDIKVIHGLVDLIYEHCDQSVVEFFLDYKLIPDVEFCNKLEAYKSTIKRKSKLIDDDDGSINREWIILNDLGNTRLQFKYILDYSKDFAENYMDQNYECITINLVPEDGQNKVVYANKILVYADAKSRDHDLMRLDYRLASKL